MTEHDGIALILHLVTVALPSELVKLTERSFASIVYLMLVSVTYILWQFPSAALVDDVCGHPATLTNLVVVVHMTIHIHTVHHDMQMRNAGFTIDVERCHILAVRQIGMCILRSAMVRGHVKRIKLVDELIDELLPVGHRPALGLFLGWGQLYADGKLLELVVALALPFRLSDMQHHPSPDGRRRQVFRQEI